MYPKTRSSIFLSVLSISLAISCPAFSQTAPQQTSPTKDQLLEMLVGKDKPAILGRTRGISFGPSPQKKQQKNFLKGFLAKSKTRAPALPTAQRLDQKAALPKITTPSSSESNPSGPKIQVQRKQTAAKSSTTQSQRQQLTKIIRENKLPTVDMVIYFEYNSAKISSNSIPDLVKLGLVLRNPKLEGSTFLVAGHTDAKGGTGYNLSLSERRARSVQGFLQRSFSIDPATLVPVGYGEEQLKNNANPFAAENRRVQIVNFSAMQ